MSTTAPWDRALRVLLVVQGVLFVALGHSEAPQAWTVLSSYFAEIAADLLGRGGHVLDGYDGLVFGPLFYGALEAPLLAVLGRIGAVHTTATAIVALAATWFTYRFVSRVATPRAGFLAALLVGFPPPNTWVHQHFGAYHVLPLVLVPAAGLLIFPRGAESRPIFRRWVGAGILVGGSLGASLGSISLGPPLVAARLLMVGRTDGVAAAGRRAGAATIGALIGLSPLAWKGLMHVPWSGLAPEHAGAAEAVKPFFLGDVPIAEMLLRPLTMLVRDLPYGLHFGMEGMEVAGWAFCGVAYAAVAAACAAAWRARADLPLWVPILAVPPAVVLVGAITGWFVFHPGDGEGWTRDARHIVGLTLALSWIIGIQADRLDGRLGRRAVLLVMVLAAASFATQIMAVARADGELHLDTPWRLEGRFVSGFFRGPAFQGAPEAAVRSCAVLPDDRRRGCLRGVALAFGHSAGGLQTAGRPTGPTVRDRIARLGVGAEIDVLHGLGWAHAQTSFGKPGPAVERCRSDESLTLREQALCIEGVGWGYAMDFGDRPAVLYAATTRLDSPDQRAFARGVGVLIGDLIADPGAHDRRCELVLPDALQADCRASR
jgi:hypothetical protein